MSATLPLSSGKRVSSFSLEVKEGPGGQYLKHLLEQRNSFPTTEIKLFQRFQGRSRDFERGAGHPPVTGSWMMT